MASVYNLLSTQYSGDIRVDSLLFGGGEWLNWNYVVPERNTLYYTFTQGASIVLDAMMGGIGNVLSEFNLSQKDAAREIFAYAGKITGINFVETNLPSRADIHFANTDILDDYTVALCSYEFKYYYNPTSYELTSYTAEAYVYLDNNEYLGDTASLVKGTFGYEALLHEIGHALGLEHPFEGAYRLPSYQDNTNNTVMSYTEAGAYKSQFQSYDLLALNWIYGGDGLAGTYGQNSLLGSSIYPPKTVFTSGNDRVNAGSGNENFNGLAGTDTIVFPRQLADYQVTLNGGSYTVKDFKGAGGTDTLTSIERLSFADFEVNLTIQETAASMAPGELKLLQELYVAFFNRVPDANGLEFWMEQRLAGQSINSIADAFYAAGVQAGDVTGYYPSMSASDFINVVYRNVLGRTNGADQEGLNYWSKALASGQETRGSLVTSIINAAYSYEGDATWGWVPALLDNKAEVANQVAVDWGLTYKTATESIQEGMAIAAAITPWDTSAAIALVGVDADNLLLS